MLLGPVTLTAVCRPRPRARRAQVKLNNKSFVSATKTAQAVKAAAAVAAAAAAGDAGGGGAAKQQQQQQQLGRLKCGSCGAQLEGEAAAAQHARETGHQQFEQV
jgi:hypothetical protein